MRRLRLRAGQGAGGQPRKEFEYCVAWGSRTCESYALADPPAFSPDGKQVALGARAGAELKWKVMAIP